MSPSFTSSPDTCPSSIVTSCYFVSLLSISWWVCWLDFVESYLRNPPIGTCRVLGFLQSCESLTGHVRSWLVSDLDLDFFVTGVIVAEGWTAHITAVHALMDAWQSFSSSVQAPSGQTIEQSSLSSLSFSSDIPSASHTPCKTTSLPSCVRHLHMFLPRTADLNEYSVVQSPTRAIPGCFAFKANKLIYVNYIYLLVYETSAYMHSSVSRVVTDW